MVDDVGKIELTMADGRRGVVLRRYAPVIALAVLQLALVGLQPSPREMTHVETQDAQGFIQNGPDGRPGGSGSVLDAGVSGVSGASATEQAGAVSSRRVADVGRTRRGDTSKCAAGGLIQENVTSYAIPCVPRFEGDNGGATSPGVTGDEVRIVVYYPRQDPATAPALVAAEVAASEPQHQEALDLYAKFFEKHYELYGRRIKPFTYFSSCANLTPACVRADAKEIKAKFDPFMAPFYGPGAFGPLALADSLANLGIITFNARNNVPASWYQQRRPYVWNILPDGDRMTDMIADYYCKKLSGKPASEAGDPALRIRSRKYGIITSEEPPLPETAQRLKRLVTGERCGNADSAEVYTVSADAATAQNHQSALVSRMKNDGITTISWLQGNVLGCQECDQQRFFPEKVITGMSLEDLDVIGRLDADSSRDNRFGLGLGPRARPRPEQDYRKAAADVNPAYDMKYPAGQASWLILSFAATLIQWAGPNLTPENLERGAHTSPQLHGWTNPQPWPGWECCDPFQRGVRFARGGYTAVNDAREVFWSSTAVSVEDDQPGAWICVNDCRRYEAGQWPRGEPKQP